MKQFALIISALSLAASATATGIYSENIYPTLQLDFSQFQPPQTNPISGKYFFTNSAGGGASFGISNGLAYARSITTSNLLFESTNAFIDAYVSSGEVTPGASNNCFWDVLVNDGFGGWNRTLYVDNDSVTFQGDVTDGPGNFSIIWAGDISATGTFTGNGGGLTNINPGGITTNLQFTFNTSRTNTLYFTNGVLMKVTQP